MAKSGDELVNPVTGLRTVFRKTAQETSGELLQVDRIGEPGWITGPDHVHPLQEERFEVLSGRLGLRVGGVEHVHSTGDVIVAPAGAPHAAWNAGDDEVHVLVDFRPALRTETTPLPRRGAGGGPPQPSRRVEPVVSTAHDRLGVSRKSQTTNLTLTPCQAVG
jgi:quercetin dioxygenase-like cupin family protein